MLKRFSLYRLTVLLAIVAVPFAAFAATEKKNEPVGHPTGGGSAIEWSTTLSGHDSITLRVVGPSGDLLLSKKFNAGKNPTVRLQDLGAQPEDGVYNVEMIVSPRIPPGVAAALAAARAAGDDAAAKKALKDAGIATGVSQSDSFTVLNGMIVSPNAEESTAHDASVSGRNVTTDAVRPSFKPTTDDQVIADDLIVQGSACIGLDCVANESFGFDTVRLKENNTRIKFDDTSTSAGFPANDWQLTANDSASGGSSKFSIEDITGSKVPFTVTAGASTNSIFVDSTGRVGFRTSTPVLDLHVATSNTPAIRLEQNNSGGFTAQTWDIAGNEANFFVRDVTGGSRLPFRIRPGAPTSSVDISADGDVGVGTASPQLKLHVSASGGQGLVMSDDVNTKWVWLYNGASSAGDNPGVGWNSGSSLRFGPSTSVNTGGFTERMRIQTDGSVGIGTTAPSSKLHVNGGDIRVSGGSFIDDGVTLNVPDYVFEPGYKLMSIDHLADFIKNEKHLPNVPSATNVKETGLNISQFQMRLLEKVEELTLYTLAQHDENQKLQQRIETLEKQLATKQ